LPPMLDAASHIHECLIRCSDGGEFVWRREHLADSSGRDGEFEAPEARDREGNRFSRRVQRYASIGSNAGGVAA
jgi:hypothetical protein